MTSVFSNYVFRQCIRPNCPAGSVYVNNTKCQSTTHTCQTGYVWNGTACMLTCSLPSIFNSTTQSCIVPPTPVQSTNIWLVVGIVLVVVAIGAVVSVIVIKKYKK